MGPEQRLSVTQCRCFVNCALWTPQEVTSPLALCTRSLKKSPAWG